MIRSLALSLLIAGVSALPAIAADQCDKGSDSQRITCLTEKVNALVSVLMGEAREDGTVSGGFMLMNLGQGNNNQCITNGKVSTSTSPTMQFCDATQPTRVWIIAPKPK